MTTRSTPVTKRALSRARERRRELDRERDARDHRIEDAAARALVALEALAAAEGARDAAATEAGAAVRAVLAEDVTVERAAALLEADVADIRRLSKTASGEAGAASSGAASGGPDIDGKTQGQASVTRLPEQAGGDGDAARRAG